MKCILANHLYFIGMKFPNRALSAPGVRLLLVSQAELFALDKPELHRVLKKIG